MNRKYMKFNYPGSISGGRTLLTGIRGEKGEKKVLISGFYEPATTQPDQQVKSFVYRGCHCKEGKWYELYYPGSNVTNLYGPDFLKENNISVVGNYTLEESNNTIGCLYQGHLNGKGKWTSLTPPFGNVLNVIAHSNMNGVIVGNYDTLLIQGKAFIYDIKKKRYYDIVKEDAISITAYGIWHNGCNSYTICGGYKDKDLESEAGYLVDWDNKKKKFSNWRSYYFNNDPVKSRITHFNGISKYKDGYSLTGDWIGFSSETKLGFFATIDKKAKWYPISFPRSDITSGNSVYHSTVIGVYNEPNSPTINGFITYSS